MTNVQYFPAYMTEDAINEIYIWGKEKNIAVYRVSKYGNDITTAFLNYYEEISRDLKIVRNKTNELEKCSKKIDSLSVSCYYDKKDIIDYYLGLTCKNFPEAILLEGETSSKHGLSSITKERKLHTQNSHVDWWIYDKATPWDSFAEVKTDE